MVPTRAHTGDALVLTLKIQAKCQACRSLSPRVYCPGTYALVPGGFLPSFLCSESAKAKDHTHYSAALQGARRQLRKP